MNVAVIGTGYVGLVSGACLADFGHSVACVDTNRQPHRQLRRGEIPFYEPGLGEVVAAQCRAGRLRSRPPSWRRDSQSAVVFCSRSARPRAQRRGRPLADRSAATAALRRASTATRHRDEEHGARRHRAMAAATSSSAPAGADGIRRGLQSRVPARGLGGQRLHASRSRGDRHDERARGGGHA